MIVFRITLARYAETLAASGNPARWNPKDVKVIYTAASRSLACLENVVHRNSRGLQDRFRILAIQIPDELTITIISRKSLPTHWDAFSNMPITQAIGEQWVRNNKSAILKVPSVIIPEECNYILNPLHRDFEQVQVIGNEPFRFDVRLKGN